MELACAAAFPASDRGACSEYRRSGEGDVEGEGDRLLMESTLPDGQEKVLIARARGSRDQDAIDALVDGYEWLVNAYAVKFAGGSQEVLEELLQQGRMALLEALFHPDFVPREGIPFGAYAKYRVKNAIECSAPVRHATKVTRHTRGLTRKWNRYRMRFRVERGREPIESEIVAEANISAVELHRIQRAEQSRNPASLTGERSDGGRGAPEVADGGPTPAAEVIAEEEKEKLAERMRILLGENLTALELMAIGVKYGLCDGRQSPELSPGDVRAIRARALDEMQALLGCTDELPDAQAIEAAIVRGREAVPRRKFARRIWSHTVRRQAAEERSTAMHAVATELGLPVKTGSRTHPDPERRRIEYCDDLFQRIGESVSGNRRFIRRRLQRVVERRFGLGTFTSGQSQEVAAREENVDVPILQNLEARAVGAFSRAFSASHGNEEYRGAQFAIAGKAYAVMRGTAMQACGESVPFTRRQIVDLYYPKGAAFDTRTSGEFCRRIIGDIERMLGESDTFTPFEERILRERFCIGGSGKPVAISDIARSESLTSQQMADIAKKLPRRIAVELQKEKERQDIVADRRAHSGELPAGLA